MKAKYIIYLLLVCVFLTSCKGKKNKQNVDDPGKKQELVNSPMKRNAEDVALANKAFGFVDDFKTVETQFSLKLESPERNVSASGTLRVAQDSVMWLYIKALGFEVARAKFTKDSVFAVVKLKNQYFKGDYSLVQKFIPVAADYNILQSLFLNRMFIVPENKVESLDYFSMEMKDNNLLQISSLSNPEYLRKFRFNNTIEVNTDINRMVSSGVDYPEKNMSIYIKYSNYEDFSGHLMPKTLYVGIMGSSSLTFETNKATFNKNLNFPLNIPDSYKPFQF